MDKNEASNALKKTISFIERVRGDGGCPWVRRQTIEKQLDEFKTEIKELEDAITNEDIDNLKEELGDVFWDLLLLIKICEEEHDLKIEDVLEGICQKMIRRKPYVFGDEKAETPEEALIIWKRIKREEKENKK